MENGDTKSNVARESHRRVITLLERGELDNLTAAICHSVPGIDYLRECVATRSYEWLLEIARTNYEHGHLNAVGQLAISMLYPHRFECEVREFFLHLWRSSDIGARFSVLWRLLDYEDLPVHHPTEPSHEALFQFVNEHWVQFLDTQWSFMGHGSGARVLASVRDRLADTRFPRSKAWAYLCSAMAAPDRDEVKRLVTEYNTDDAFVERVKRELLERTDPWQPTTEFASMDDLIVNAALGKAAPTTLGAEAAIQRARRLADAKEMLKALVEAFPPASDIRLLWHNECCAMHQHFQSLFWTEFQSGRHLEDLGARGRLDRALGWTSRFAALMRMETLRSTEGAWSYRTALFPLNQRITPHEQLEVFKQYRQMKDIFPITLATQLRVVQWQVGVLNLPEARFRNHVVYQPAVGGTAGFDAKSVLWPLTEEGWRNVWRGWGPYASLCHAGTRSRSVVAEPLLEAFRSGFTTMLKRIADDPDTVSESHRDLRHNLSVEQLGDASTAVVLQDGELTFFSMLWILRYAQCRDSDALRLWLSGEIPSISVDFCFRQGHSSWTNASHERFVTMLGLLGPYAHGGWVMTPRWWSLQRWLLEQHWRVKNASKPIRDLTLEEFAEYMPINRIAPSTTVDKAEYEGLLDCARALAAFFLYAVPVILRQSSKHPGAPDPQQFVQLHFNGLMQETLDDTWFLRLLTAGIAPNARQLNDGSHDPILVRLCRSPGLPVEYMFRANQPYESHVIVLPQHYRRQDTGNDGTYAPSYITFATVVGSLPSESRDDDGTGEQSDTYKDWEGSYILPLMAMADEVASPVLAETTARFAWLAFENRLGHDASKVIALLRGDKSSIALAAIRTFLQAVFFAASPDQLVANTHRGSRANDADDSDRHITSAKDARSTRTIVEAACSVARSVHTLRELKHAPLADLTIEGFKHQQAKRTPDVRLDESLDEVCAHWDANQRLRLFTVLVIAMVNTYHHATGCIRIGLERRDIVVSNTSQNPPKAAKKVAKKVWGTPDSLRLLVSQPEYGRLASEVVMSQNDNGLWVTRIPLPTEREERHDA